MKIGIISDTHSDRERLQQVLKHLDDVDMIIHCGDWTSPGMVNFFSGMECHAVFGNCDFGHERFTDGPVTFHEPYMLITRGHICIGACHGDEPHLLRELMQKQPDLLLSGHTHRVSIEQQGPTICINPGSVAKPKDKGPSFAVFDTEKKEGKIGRL